MNSALCAFLRILFVHSVYIRFPWCVAIGESYLSYKGKLNYNIHTYYTAHGKGHQVILWRSIQHNVKLYRIDLLVSSSDRR
jgi:hypothetical protein